MIDCLLGMVMKLSEVTFRPLFFKVGSGLCLFKVLKFLNFAVQGCAMTSLGMNLSHSLWAKFSQVLKLFSLQLSAFLDLGNRKNFALCVQNI